MKADQTARRRGARQMNAIDFAQAGFADEQRNGLTAALQGLLAILIVIVI
jgi:hypothetical protein